jgi:hypothetical protein
VRRAHIHVKLEGEGHKPLTTQRFFRGVKYDKVDPWIEAATARDRTPDGDHFTASSGSCWRRVEDPDLFPSLFDSKRERRHVGGDGAFAVLKSRSCGVSADDDE